MTTQPAATARRPLRHAALAAALAALAAALAPAPAAAAGAAGPNTVLVAGSGVGSSYLTQATNAVTAAGYTVESVTDDATWNAKTAADFGTYKAIYLPANGCGAPSTVAVTTRTTWAPVITGNVLIIGGDPELHAPSRAGAQALLKNGVGFAAADTGKPGLLVALGCSTSNTTVLDQFGSFTAGGQSSDSIHIVAVHPALSGLTDTLLSNWGSSTHLKFTAYPAAYTPLAIQTDGTAPGVTSFADGTSGTIFLLAKGTGVQPVGLNVGITGPATAAAGDTLTYTITYGNSGGTDASSVVITAPVPAGTTFASATGGGTAAAGTVTWNIGTIAQKTTGLTVTYSVTAAAGTVLNTGTQITDGTNTSTANDVTTVVSAPPTGLTVSSGTAAYVFPGSAVVVDAGVTVQSGSNLDGATVDISAGFVSGQDVLACTPSGGVTCSFSATTGVLTLSGNASAATYQAVLRTVTYDNSAGAGATTGARSVTFAMGSGVKYAGSGHYYEFVTVSPSMTWAQAKADAATRSYFGLTGYLATISSSGENAFVAAKVAADGWIGAQASGNTYPRTWSWQTGPESSTSICNNTAAGTCTAISSAYTNWNTGEPNNAGGNETVCEFFFNGATWNDLPPTSTLTGYIAEYGGTAGDPVLTLSGTRALSVTVSAFPVAFQTDGTTGATLSGTTSQSVLAGGSSSAVTAVPSATTYFVNWTGTGGFATTTSNPVTSTNVTAAQTITAHFAAKATPTMALGSSANPTTYGGPVTLTASLVSSVAVPTGSVVFKDGAATLCTSSLSAGAATCAVPLFAAGTHALSASYAGDGFNLSASAGLSQVVNKAATSTALAASPTPSTYGQPVTLTATVSSAVAGFGGMVAFSDGGVAISGCGLQPLSGATATCALPASLAAGTHAFSADYLGAANFAASTGAASHVVAKATPTVTLASGNPSAVFGEPVTFTTTVDYGLFVPTGSVTVMNGAAVVCGPVALSAGAATCASQALVVGTHALTAVYAADPNFNGGTSAKVSQLVVRGTTVTDLVADRAQAVWGEPVLLTATVGPDAPSVVTPTGTITFRDSANVVCANVPVQPDGTATCSTSGLSVEVHALSARFNGSAGYASSTSFAFAVRVDKAATTATITPSLASTVFGQPVGFTLSVAAVAPGAGVAGGTVTLSDGGSAVAGCTGLALTTGSASCSTSALAAGSHALTVAYAGDAHFVASSGAAAFTVARAATTTTLAAAPASPIYGQAVTLTATTTAVSPGAGTPAGTVQFFDGATLLGSATPSGGVATFVVGLPAAGAHAFGATYGGSASFVDSTSAVRSVTVGQATPSAALASSSPTSEYGHPVTFTLTLGGPAGAAAPAGTAAFTAGAATLCAAAPVAAGVATCTVSSLLPGSHTVTAVSSGDASYLAASASVGQVVARSASTVTVVATPNPSVFGQPVTLSVVVSGAGVPASGTVSLSETGGVLCGGTLALTGGAASCTTSSLAAGAHAVTASFAGDANYLASTGTRTVTVERALTATGLALGASATVYGEPLTLTATVDAAAPGAGFPAGTVDFYEGETLVGSAELDPVSGQAVLTTAALAVGAHDLAAAYAGDASFQGSISVPAQQVVVGPASTAVAVVSSVNPAVFGQPVSLGIEVAAVAPGAGVPAGDVSVTVDGVEVQVVTLDAAGRATVALPGLPVGSHAIGLTFLGEVRFLSSTAGLSQVVERAATSVALASAVQAPVFGQPITLTATVTVEAPGAGAPSGTVAFRDGAAAIAGCEAAPVSAGQATCTTAALAAGGHVLTAAYGGDGSFLAATSADAALSVAKAGVAVALAADPAPSVFGQAVTLRVAVAAVAPGAGTPSGTVVVSDGATVLGAVTLVDGAASLATAALAVGAHDLSAAYAGDDSFLAGGGTGALVVEQASTRTTLAAAPSPSVFGQPVRLTAGVTAVAPGAGAPSGTVTFKDGAAALGAVTLAGGTAALDLGALQVGSHAFTAEFSGDASFSGSVAAAAHEVARAGTTAALALAPSAPIYGQPVTASVSLAVVAPGAGVPAGLVTVSHDGAVLCAGPAVAGAFSCAIPSAAVGAHAVSAAFDGGTSFAAASAGATYEVAQSPSTLSVASSRNPSRRGRDVTFTATASAAHATPAGTVTFKADGSVLGTAALDGGVATFTDRSLVKKAGPYVLTAELGATPEFGASVATLSGGQVVENSPPVAGSGTALAFGPAGATGAAIHLGGALDAGDLTLEAWIKPAWTSPDQAGAEPTVLALGAGAAARFHLGVSPDRTHLTWSAGGAARAAAAPLDDGAWHHVALVAAGGLASVYVDGYLSDSAEAAPAAAGEDLALGAGFVGQLDELRAWSVGRTAAELRADAGHTVPATAAGLAGAWRMDEGAGVELFDATAAHHDGRATLDPAEGAAAFAASTAWRRHEVKQERWLTPAFDAGYDLDGDELALTITQAAQHGSAHADQAALQATYLAGDRFLGQDAFGYAVSDGEAEASFELALDVTRILTCQASADCGGGDVCLQGVCIAPTAVEAAASGCGCSTGNGASTGLWAFLALALLRRRRAAA